MKPRIPLARNVTGAVGDFIRESVEYFRGLQGRSHLWGNEVQATFPGASTPTRIVHGLVGTPRGYHVVRANADIRVWDDPTTNHDGTALWLQASGAGTVTLYVY